MIETLYNKYFQKSKVFLYPILELEKCFNINSTTTYLFLKDHKEDDMYLYVLFKINDYKSFTLPCRKKIIYNKFFHEIKILSNTEILITFNLFPICSDWEYFIEGKYSKFSKQSKDKILKFFNKDKANYVYVESFLYPEKYFNIYSHLLNVNLYHLEKTGELCDKLDIDKETLNYSSKDLEKYTNTLNIVEI